MNYDNDISNISNNSWWRRPLFGHLANEILLSPIYVTVFDNQFVLLKYQVIK